MKRAKDGDARALDALCERHAPRVERLAHHVLRDPRTPRCVAGSAREALREAAAVSGRVSFSTWLHRLTVNACRDVAQRQVARRCEPLEEDCREARDGDPAAAAEASELRAELGACLAEISPAQAKVVVLKDAFEFSFEEIAGAEGMPVGTAKCYAHRGRNGLRGRLSA